MKQRPNLEENRGTKNREQTETNFSILGNRGTSQFILVTREQVTPGRDSFMGN